MFKTFCLSTLFHPNEPLTSDVILNLLRVQGCSKLLGTPAIAICKRRNNRTHPRFRTASDTNTALFLLIGYRSPRTQFLRKVTPAAVHAITLFVLNEVLIREFVRQIAPEKSPEKPQSGIICHFDRARGVVRLPVCQQLPQPSSAARAGNPGNDHTATR